MNRILLLGVPVALLAAGWLVFSPSTPQRPMDPDELPWNFEVLAADKVRVFGLWLGESTLGESEQHFGVPAEAGLFVDPGGKRSVEAYFDRLSLAGLSAKLVLELEADPALFERLEEQATRRISLRSGSVRLELPAAADAELRQLKIRSLTYAPRVDLEEATLRQRFGQPERVIVMDERRSHWLYPTRGLDILVDNEDREILQYLLPIEFDRLLALLPQD